MRKFVNESQGFAAARFIKELLFARGGELDFYTPLCTTTLYAFSAPVVAQVIS